MLVAIAGRAGAGKSTIADILVRDHGFAKLSLADPIREIAELFGFEIKKPYPIETRRALQAIGYTGRLIDKDIWVKMLIERVKLLQSQGVARIVVDDVRFPNECALLKAFGFYIVKIKISEKELQKRMKEHYIPPHVESERYIEIIEADYIIDGNSEPTFICEKILAFMEGVNNGWQGK